MYKIQTHESSVSLHSVLDIVSIAAKTMPQ